MTITIPIWILWGLGGIAAIVVLFLALFGCVVIYTFSGGFFSK